MFPDRFTDLTNGVDYESSLQGSLSTTFAYRAIKAELGSSVRSATKYRSRNHYVISTMRIERYYSSLKEEDSTLTDDAYSLLNSQDYVGFFKSCGPNYIRGIRRAQEVTAIFKFRSSSLEIANEFANGLQVRSSRYGVDGDFFRKSKYNSIRSSIEIKILGFGLGLNQDGSETLVATDLSEYNKVMKFAFQSMTQSEDSPHIGMVYGMEVMPWVDNTEFQVAARVQDENIDIPLPRSLIPKAITRDSNDQTPFANNNSTRALYKCKDPAYKIDKYGYCCDEETLFNPDTENYEDEPSTVDQSTRVCKPRRVLDRSIAKNNMAINGEFVARLDGILRYRTNQLFTLEKCVSAVRSIPNTYSHHILKPQDTVKYDETIEFTFTVAELRMALDPKADYGMVKHMGRELDEFITMFYRPCIAAIFGTNVGSNPGTDPQFFMAYPWYDHDECSQLSCLADNMRWDREGTGCIPSLLTGQDSPDTFKEDLCALDEDANGEEEVCKHSTETLNDYRTGSKLCWSYEKDNALVPIYLIDHFCMPQLQDLVVTDESRKKNLDEREIKCRQGFHDTSAPNVISKTPSTPALTPGGELSKGVPGEIPGVIATPVGRRLMDDNVPTVPVVTWEQRENEEAM